MSWSTKVKAFCVEAYFANNSYKVEQASFPRKCQCRHAPSKSRIFDWIQKFREYGTVQNLISNGLTRDTYSGRTVSARAQRNINAVQDSVTTYASLPLTPWRPFGAYFGKNINFMRTSMTETLGNDCIQTEV